MKKRSSSQNFEKLLLFLHENEAKVIKLLFANGECINAVYDTDYDEDNELEQENPNYEVYQVVVMRNIITNSLFEFNYHNMPKEAYCDNYSII